MLDKLIFFNIFKFNGPSPKNILVQPVEKLSSDKNTSVNFNNIKKFETELEWIKLLQTATLFGLNDSVYHERNISKLPDFDDFSLLEIQKHKSRSHGKRQQGNDKRKTCAAQKSNTYDLSTKLRDQGQHAMLSLLSCLPIAVLRILYIETNRFDDRYHQMYDAALLTRCYTQHALHPFIHSELNHKRHFINIPFINKGMDFIDLPSILQDKSVTLSIPDYFQNSELPMICYKYKQTYQKHDIQFQ